MNTELMFSSKSDLWETPQALFDELNAEFNFDVDVCAIPENAKVKRYFTPAVDGLKQTGPGGFGVTRLMAGLLVNGLKKAIIRQKSGGRWWLCFYRRALIQNGFTSTFTTNQKYDLLKGG